MNHPTLIQRLIPAWTMASDGEPMREYSKARARIKELSVDHPGVTYRLFCPPHTYHGVNYWGKPFTIEYDAIEVIYRNGLRVKDWEETISE